MQDQFSAQSLANWLWKNIDFAKPEKEIIKSKTVYWHWYYVWITIPPALA